LKIFGHTKININKKTTAVGGVFFRAVDKPNQAKHRYTHFGWFEKIFNYAILATFLARRATLREAVFFGIVLPAAFIILLSAARVAATAAALSPDSMAAKAFLVAVFTALLRAVLIAFFFSVTKILFLQDL
jgi:hypothetical protein